MIKSKARLAAFLIWPYIVIAHCPAKQIVPAHAYEQSVSSNCNELTITLLHPHIGKAITDFYGFNRRYEIGDSKLEILNRDGNIFTVKVTVDTFEGAHNEYFTEIMTFTITPSSVTLESYRHTDFIK